MVAGLILGLVALPVYFSALLQRLRRANTELHDMSRELAQLAQEDPLTGLPNRRKFQEYLQRALAHARHHRTGLAVLFLDLDKFKRVNDSMGHHAGDQLLHDLSQRLTGCLREEDLLSRQDMGEAGEAPDGTLARVGGDEFLILLPCIRNGSDAATVAQRLLDTLAEPFVLGESEVCVGGSIGISSFPADGADVETLIRTADMAMYHAKQLGQRYQYFNESMNAAVVERLAIENSLRRAIDNREFRLHYQPKIDLRRDAIAGVEALIRWQHPDRGIIPAGDFITVAEETGLIIPISEWLIDEATRQIRCWEDAGLELSMSINISVIQLNQQNLVDVIRQGLEKHQCRADHLELELAETSITEAHDRVAPMLDELKRLGLQICVDDFGVGYSSLRHLRNLSIDTLKIDRSLIRGIATDRNDASIVAAILAMAHALELQTLAEGVETREQLQFLRARDCDIAQGYLFSHPLPDLELRRFISNQGAGRKADRSRLSPV